MSGKPGDDDSNVTLGPRNRITIARAWWLVLGGIAAAFSIADFRHELGDINRSLASIDAKLKANMVTYDDIDVYLLMLRNVNGDRIVLPDFPRRKREG